MNRLISKFKEFIKYREISGASHAAKLLEDMGYHNEANEIRQRYNVLMRKH